MSDDAQQVGFDVVIAAPGARETMDSLVSGLRNVGQAAAENAAKVDATRASYDRYVQSSGAAAQQAAILAANNLTLDDLLDRVNGRVKASTDRYREQSAQVTQNVYQTRQMALAQMEALKMQEALNGSYVESRATVLAHAQALEMDAAITQAAAAAQAELAAANAATTLSFDASTAGLGRVRQGLVSFVAQASGTMPVVDRLGASLLTGFGVNTVTMVAGLVAIGGALWVYDKMTAGAREAAKAQDELTSAAEKWYKVDSLGIAGARVQQLDAELKKLKQLNDEYVRQQQILATPAHASPAGGGLGIQYGAIGASKTASDRSTAQGTVDALGADVNAQLTKAINERETLYVHDLANLVRYGDANKQQEAIAAGLIADFQHQLDTAAKSASPAFRNQLLEWMNTLKDAEAAANKVTTEPVSHGENSVVKSILEQVDAMRKVDEANAVEAMRTQQAIALRAVDAESRGVLEVHQKAELDRLEAYGTKSGIALTERLKGIAGIEAQNTVLAQNEEALRRASDTAKINGESQAMMGEAMHKIAAMGEYNNRITLATEDSKKFGEITAKLANTIQNDLLRAAEQFATHGVLSWHSLFEEAGRLSDQFTAQLSSNIAEQTRLLDEANKKHEDGLAKSIQAQISHYEDLKRAALDAAAAAAGGLAGYSVGSQTTNATTGALGGAAAGVAAGAAAGVPGMIIGGLAGAVGGLFGAAAAHRAAAAALEKAAAAVHLSLLQMNAEAGTGTALESQLAQAHDQAKKLFDAIDAALPGLKNQIEREKEMTQVRNDETIITQKLIDADRVAKAQTEFSLKARQDYALGMNADGDAVTRLAAEQKELFDAIQSGASAATIADIAYTQSLEDAATAAAKAAAATKANSDAQAGYEERLLTATGQSDKEFQYAQQKEYNDAMLSGLNGISLGILREAQEAEAAQRERQKQTTALNAQLQTEQSALSTAQQQLQAVTQLHDSFAAYSASLKVGSLSPLSPTDQLAEARKQLQADYSAALGGDQKAATNFQGLAQTLLQTSKTYNASGSGYVDDFNSVQSMTDALTNKYGEQESLAQQTVDALNQQIALLKQEIDATNNISASLTPFVLANDAQTPSNPSGPGGIVVGGTLAPPGTPVAPDPSSPPPANSVSQLTLDAIDHGNNLLQSIIDATNGVTGAVNTLQQALVPGSVVSAPRPASNPSAPPPDTSGGGSPPSGSPGNPASGGGQIITDPYMENSVVPLVPGQARFTDTFGNSWFDGQWHSYASLNPPGFASGGDFGGGLRLVGEQGPELEVTGPSHIFSASQTQSLLNNEDVLAELRAIRAGQSKEGQAATRQQDLIAKTSFLALDAVRKEVAGMKTAIQQAADVARARK